MKKPTLSEFANQYAQKQNMTAASEAEVVLDMITVTPDDYVEDVKTAEEYGQIAGVQPPLPLVNENRDDFRGAIEKHRRKSLLNSTTHLSDWLRNPENATVASDSLEELSWFEGAIRGVKNTFKRSAAGLDQAGSQFMAESTARRAADRKKSFGELLEDQKLEMYDMAGNKIDTGAGPVEWLGAAARWMDARYADLIGTDDEAAAAQFLKGVGEAGDRLRSIPKSDIATRFETEAMVGDGQSLGETLKNWGVAALKNPLGAFSWALETAGEMAPQLAAAAATTALTRNPAAGGTVLGAGSYLTERYRSPLEWFEKQGIDIRTPEGVQEVLSSPDIMKQAAEHGAVRGLVIAALDVLSMGVVGGRMSGNPVIEAIAQGLSQAIMGGGGEMLAQMATEGGVSDWNEVVAEGFAEVPTVGIDAMTAGRRVLRDGRKAEEAPAAAETLGQIFEKAAQSRVRERMPSKFQEFLAKVNAGSPIETTYIDGQKFAEYFQSVGVDPFEIADTFDGLGAEALRAAILSGGDVTVPTAALAANVPGSGHEEFFLRNSRFDPEDGSLDFAEEFNATVEEIRQEVFEEIERERQEIESLRTFQQEIYDTMVSNLRTAGVSTDVATTQASLYSAFYSTLAERSGLTVEEFMNKFSLPGVRGSRPEGIQPTQVDETTRYLAAARMRKAGKPSNASPLAEFISEYGGINDVGGDIRSIVDNDGKIKRRGKKTLKLVRDQMQDAPDMIGGRDAGKKFDTESVAVAAIEAGLMGDNPVVQEYKNALAEGRPVPSLSDALKEELAKELAGPTVDVEADEADQLEQYLNSLGVSLDDEDQAILDAIRAAEVEAEDARKYAQLDPANMVVQHNLSVSNLLHADRMRGLAVPSIAIANVDYPLDGFGDITLIGAPDMVDPKKDRSAKTFNADVYSPRYPTVRYKLNSKAMKAAWKKLEQASADLGHVLSGEIDNGEVERNGMSAFRDSTAAQLQFLREQGSNVELPQVEPKTDYTLLVPELSGMMVDSYSVNNLPEVRDAVNLAIHRTIEKVAAAAPDIDLADFRENFYDRDGSIRRSVIEQIRREIEDRRNPGVDKRLARYAVRDAIKGHEKEFAEWVENNFGDVIAEEKIVTETASGDLKLLPHTLDNVVKVMKAGLRDGENFNYGVGSIRSKVAKQFKSVKDIQANRDKLIPADAMDALKDEINEEFVALAGVFGQYENPGVSNSFGWLDIFSERLKEMADTGGRYPYGNNVPAEVIQAGRDFLEKLANMPTEYFEAKLQRAVGLDEFKAAVIPNDTPQEARNVLMYSRVPVVEYDPNVEGSRAAAIRKAASDAKVLFQRDNDLVESEAFKRWFGDSKVVDDQGKPLVVYHGTMAGDFEAFSGEAVGRTGEADTQKGDAFFFTNLPQFASEFAEGREGINFVRREAQYGGSVYPAYVSLKNPVYVADNGVAPDIIARNIEYAKANGHDGVIVVPQRAVKFKEEDATNPGRMDGWRPDATWRILSEPESIDLSGDYSFMGQQYPVTVVAFRPEQIKSIHNRGTFDPSDPRIMYQGGEDENGVTAVDIGGGTYEILVNGEKAGTISIAGDGSGDFVSLAALEPAFQGRRIGHAAYDQIEAAIGRRLVPSPLGLSANGRGFWRRRFSAMSPEDRADALRRAKEAGLSYGISEADIDNRLAFLSDGAVYNQGEESVSNPFEQSTGQGARGSIEIPAGGVENGQAVINLFQSHNLSTFLHESGHFFLEVMMSLEAQGVDAIADEMNIVRGWWAENAKGVAADATKAAGQEISADAVLSFLQNGTTGDLAIDGAIKVGVHEQWARAFEAYLMEGKAPSVELRGAFERFAAWLVAIYKSLRGLNVQPSDELRRVFDRMLATDEEIAVANEVSGAVGPVFATAEQMGLTDEEYDAYLKMRAKAEDEAKMRLRREIMEPLKREQEEWYKEERRRVRAEAEREVNRYRQYRAFEWMANGRWWGEDKPEDMPKFRLDKQTLIDRYGEGVLRTLPRGRSTVYTVDGGVDPDIAAAWFGFTSGDEMIRALESVGKPVDGKEHRVGKREEDIEALTDQRMREQHGDVLRDGSVELKAIEAVHGDRKGEWIAAEIKAIAEVAGLDFKMTNKDARYLAKQTLAKMNLRDAGNSRTFLAAERRAAEEAAKLSAMLARDNIWLAAAKRRVGVKARAAIRTGNVDQVAGAAERLNSRALANNELVKKLVDAKRRQLLNHQLYEQSRNLVDEISKADRLVQRLQKASHREKLAFANTRENAQVDYLAAIDEILETYDFRKLTAKQERKRMALNAYVEAMVAAGRANELAIPDHVLQPGGSMSRPSRHLKTMARNAGRIPYKTLSVEEFRGVIDSLKNIEHSALEWNKFLVRGQKRDFEEAIDTIVTTIEERTKGEAKQWAREAGLIAGSKKFVAGYLGSIQKADYLLRKLDGREDIGPVYELLKSNLDRAAQEEVRLSHEAAVQLQSLFDMYTPAEQRQMGVLRVHDELGGRSFSKWSLIAAGLNMGNEGNLARLTNPQALQHFTEAEIEHIKNNVLDERDARFIQGVWDYINSFWPMIEEREKRVKGVAPEKVPPMPVTIGGVDLRGGYYPIKYDGDQGGGRPTATESDDDILQSILSGGYASAHTKDGHLKLRTDASKIKQSIVLDPSVIVRHLNEVIHDLTHGEAVVSAWKLLTNPAVERAFIEKGMNEPHRQLKLWVQDAATGQVGANDALTKAITYLRGGFAYSKLAFSIRTILLQPLGFTQSMVVVGKKRMLASMMKTYASLPTTVGEVEGKSQMMRRRRDTFNKDLMDAVPQVTVGSTKIAAYQRFINDWIAPIGMAAMVAAQYYSVDVPTWVAAYEKGLEQFADEDKAVEYADQTVQRAQGSGIWSDRSAIERGTLSHSRRQDPWVVLLTTLGSYFFAKMNIAMERTDALLDEKVTLQRAISYAMDMSLLFVMESTILAVGASIMGSGGDDDDEGSIAGDIAVESMKGFAAGLPLIRDAVGLLQGFDPGTYGALLKAFVVPMQQASQGEVDRAFVKSLVNLGGILGRLPSAQANRVIDAGWRDAEGEDVAPVEYLMGRQR